MDEGYPHQTNVREPFSVAAGRLLSAFSNGTLRQPLYRPRFWLRDGRDAALRPGPDDDPVE